MSEDDFDSSNHNIAEFMEKRKKRRHEQTANANKSRAEKHLSRSEQVINNEFIVIAPYKHPVFSLPTRYITTQLCNSNSEEYLISLCNISDSDSQADDKEEDSDYYNPVDHDYGRFLVIEPDISSHYLNSKILGSFEAPIMKADLKAKYGRAYLYGLYQHMFNCFITTFKCDPTIIRNDTYFSIFGATKATAITTFSKVFAQFYHVEISTVINWYKQRPDSIKYPRDETGKLIRKIQPSFEKYFELKKLLIPIVSEK